MHEQLAQEMIESVKSYVAKREQAINERIAALELAIKSIPAPEKGEKGDTGEPGRDGQNGAPGKDGLDGKDAIAPTAQEVAQVLEGDFAKWALDFERRAQDIFHRAIEKMPLPADGKDGRDALSLENFNAELLEDGRTIKMTLANESTSFEKTIKLACVIDKGVFREGAYEKGDGVTYGGSFYIAQKDAPEGKPSSSDDWRLAVKRGRDGREAVKIGGAK